MKQKYNCDWCGAEVFRYASSIGKHVFCCKECRSSFLSKATNPDGYIRHPHLTEYNLEHNEERMTESVRLKIREKKLRGRKADTYEKYLGVHVHRMVAEQKMGRKLKLGEVVHHIDGDKQNNSPDNLMVLASQAEHAALHRRMGGEADEVHSARLPDGCRKQII